MGIKDIDPDLLAVGGLDPSKYLDSLGYGDRIIKLAKETSHETTAIESRLSALVQQAECGEIDSLDPTEFLGASSLQLWQEGQRIEPIIYLYDKYYTQELNIPDQTDKTTLGITFTGTMAEIASRTDGVDRQNLILATIGFLTRKNPDLEARIYEFAYFAKDLVIHGAEKEGRELATFLKANVPPEIAGEWTFNELIKEAFGTAE